MAPEPAIISNPIYIEVAGNVRVEVPSDLNLYLAIKLTIKHRDKYLDVDLPGTNFVESQKISTILTVGKKIEQK